MGKGSGKGSVGSSRIRFIMLDADLNDGDLNQITQAITNALRPTVVQRALPALPRGGNGASAGPTSEEEIAESYSDVEEATSEKDSPPTRPSSGPTKPRVYKQPKVLEIDLNAGQISFPAYAQGKNPPDELSKRYLVVATWFKEYQKLDAITIDHIYTAFRRVKWATNIVDFDLPFRQLIKRGWMKREDTGSYAITVLGVAEVEQMGDVDSEMNAAP